MKLTELQQQFSQYLLYQSSELADLKITGPFAAEQLMALYRNNFYISITEYLQGCFLSVAALVGEDFFAQLAKAFIIAQPLRCASIEVYGSDFANFISCCEQAKSVPYLADIARLDWAVDRAKSELLHAEFPFARLAALSSEAQLEIYFELPPNTVLLASNHPVLSIWLGVKQGGLESIDMHSQEIVIICPDRVEGAKVTALSKAHYQFLAAINNQQNLQSLSKLDNFQQLLSDSITAGFINNFILEGEL